LFQQETLFGAKDGTIIMTKTLSRADRGSGVTSQISYARAMCVMIMGVLVDRIALLHQHATLRANGARQSCASTEFQRQINPSFMCS